MELEALQQSLASLDTNTDEVEDERYAKAFHILFSTIEKQNEKIEFFKAEIQKLRDEINLFKGEQNKLKIHGSKKNESILSILSENSSISIQYEKDTNRAQKGYKRREEVISRRA
ncbi:MULTISPECIES: hypothetical protein [Methanosarcina]|uniref:Uncharacterized protein n=3 Tax=Methanosarcina barkeri TaxID=2208 RepID=A0A0E3QSK4_METBA|nr:MULTISPECIES: hypothetical protein [Methanosarcina]AKB54239.1 hypothetical protein MSBRM_1241 [Methanosarcina barkeri MS]AKB57685.1 hypothetical protein MSBR2_1169 [Methanosarcina barkeri 227]AKJ38232.1 hypothetical protein MCM1_1176 [Methanosarcina barkeri CM1]OEC90419.1 hypothetical protein A9239_04620 [Methanosarcina sp. A14]